ncbi:MAG: hypothetical protein J5I47_06510 [Vicingus serpentipes]|nr:hypothetical protein [Vicingus serpentipes]
MDATITKTATLVAKEDITGLTFPKTDVLSSIVQQEERTSKITRGMQLGNSKKLKVKIVFEDLSGLKKVETTIWGLTEKSVILKKGTTIPIHCIHEIKFF